MTDYKYVQQPAQPEILKPNDLYVREYAQGVWIPLLQNLFGGLFGAGGLVAIITWRAGMMRDDALLLGAIVGGIAFCTATMIRAFRDEVRFMLAAYGERQDRATRTAQQAELEQLRREIKELRSQGILTRKVEALMAAERLLREHFDLRLKITRPEAMKRGYTRTQWDAAMDLIRAAQVVNGHSVVLVPTFAEAWAKVLHAQSAGMGSFAVTETGDVVRKA